jgi:hypothetical protein
MAGAEHGGGGEYDLTITGSYFSPSPVYSARSGRDTMFLHWTGTTSREAQPVMDANSYHPSFNCGVIKGEDWVSHDGGKTVSNPNDVKFGRRSRVQEMIDRVLGLKGSEFEGQALIPEGHPDDVFEDADPRDASLWIGLKFKMGPVEREVEVPDDADPRKRVKRTISYDMPLEYLGKGDGQPVPASPAAAPGAPVPGTVVEPVAAATNPAVLKARLTGLAKSSSSFESFTAAALEIPGVADDAELLNSVFDETGGLYATARG